MTEIPLLRESSVFAHRLIQACRGFAESRYRFHRRINWSYRYASTFYEGEAARFHADSAGYLEDRLPLPESLEDVLAQRLSPRQVVQALLKVSAHWLFHWLGLLANGGIRRGDIRIYRKGYVDDIELVFDPDEPGVLRGIHPFPLNLRRQLRYLRQLRHTGRRFKLDGNPYLPGDVWRLLVRRDMMSLLRLESRAQLRHAQGIVGLGVRLVQLSDEFDIGSLDFCRMLARYPVKVVNSAHGVGKYYPAHAYQTFDVLTLRQQQYYLATRPCEYRLRRLNDKTSAQRPVEAPSQDGTPVPGVRFVFLSQVFVGISDIIASNEATVVQRLADAYANDPRVTLLYRRHPNSDKQGAPRGFVALARLEDVNGLPGTVYGSFFSTSQIDPTFKGRKLLIRGERIHPEIAFDADETILNLDGLVCFLGDRASEAMP
jgi:hypothetical protein